MTFISGGEKYCFGSLQKLSHNMCTYFESFTKSTYCKHIVIHLLFSYMIKLLFNYINLLFGVIINLI